MVYPTGPPICGSPSDPACKVRITSARDWGLIIVYAYWGLNILTYTIWVSYKSRRLTHSPVQPFVIVQKKTKGGNTKEQKRSVNDDIVAKVEKGEELRVPLEDVKEVRFTGYKRTLFGECCWYLACLTSVHWIALWLVLLVDTYNKCQVKGIDSLCFYGNYFIFGTYEFNATVFFVLWWLLAIWYLCWMLNRDQVHNWFRMPCKLSEARLVHAWAPHQQEILSTNVSFLVRIARRIKDLVIPQQRQGHSETVVIQKTGAGTQYFLFQGQRYLLGGDTAYQSNFAVGTTYSDFLQASEGLSTQVAEERLELLGPNEIPFRAEPFWFTVYDEVFTLFHAYQAIMYLEWLWFAYLFVAAILITVVVLSACITIYTRRKSQLAIAKITYHKTEAAVMRSGKWAEIESREVVPGDVLKIKNDWLLPCDVVITQGFCVCDESNLTGEAMPVQKYAPSNLQDVYDPEGRGARHTLFSGTTVLQAGTSPSDEVVGVVSATGMATSKGNLLSSILYPDRMVFKYDEELPIVVLALLCYACVCFMISLLFQQHNGQQSIWVTKFVYCTAILSQTVSPLLPVALEVGQLHAVDRLKQVGIHCLNPKRIAIAGKIRVFCFDKTGTLTKNGLDFIGIQSSHFNAEGKSAFKDKICLEDVDMLTMHGLATCHAVTKFGEQYVGNEVEVRMFSATGWDLVEAPEQHPVVRKGDRELTIIKRHEFDHSRATMSVIVQDAAGECVVYCKGSFENIGELSDVKSLPQDYLKVAQGHSLNGCYTLGLSYRSLGKPENIEDLLSMPREELETGLHFLALIMFRNELKADSRGAIEALKSGEVRTLMVTGDNAQTGYYIAKQCALVEEHIPVMLAELESIGRVTWSTMGTTLGQNQRKLSTEELLLENSKALESGAVELAVTGKAFNALLQTEAMTNLLFYTRIFARFTPEDKVKVTNMHRDLGLVVGMCGDGGNDCGALRSAHAGVALSTAEASVVSPFTSETKSVVSVVDLLREGRGALHTSFACYKFLIMYGLTFSIFKLACNWYGVIACQMDYMIIDGVAVITLGYSMTLSQPSKKLNKERPTSSLLGAQNVASILGVWTINVLFLTAALIYMTKLPGYVQWPAQYSAGASWWLLGDNWETTVIFFTLYLQFVTTAFSFTFGATFRRSVLWNYCLTGAWATIVCVVSCVILLPSNGFTKLFHMSSEQFNRLGAANVVWQTYQEKGGLPSPAMDFSERLRLWILILVNMCCIALWTKVVINGPVAKLVARKFPSPTIKFRM
ncbi:unnamed protein product [Calypogeia fissa]